MSTYKVKKKSRPQFKIGDKVRLSSEGIKFYTDFDRKYHCNIIEAYTDLPYYIVDNCNGLGLGVWENNDQNTNWVPVDNCYELYLDFEYEYI